MARSIGRSLGTAREPPDDGQQFRAFGIDPAAKRVVGLKSMLPGGLRTPDLTKLPYRRVRRPIFPLDL